MVRRLLCMIAISTVTVAWAGMHGAGARQGDFGWTVDPKTGTVTATMTRQCDEFTSSVTLHASAVQTSKANGEPRAVADGQFTYTCAGPAAPFVATFELSSTTGRLHPGPATFFIGVVQCSHTDASHTTTFCHGGSGSTEGWLGAAG